MKDRVLDQLSLIGATALATAFASEAVSGELVRFPHPNLLVAGLAAAAVLVGLRLVRSS